MNVKKAAFLSFLLFASTASFGAECTKQSDLLVTKVDSSKKTTMFALTGGQSVKAEDLNEFDFVVKTYSLNDKGELSLVTGSVTAGNTVYKTIYAFNQYKTVDGKRYGVSIRMQIDFVAKNAAASFANLFGLLGVKGSTDTLDGTISLSAHGMKNSKAAFVLPVPARIDDSSAAQFLNYMTILKTLIAETNSVDPVELPECI